MEQSGNRRVTVLGATGSIGKSAAIELAEHARAFRVTALAARSSIDELARQAALLHPKYVITADESLVPRLAAQLPSSCRALGGTAALTEVAASPETDILLCAIIGIGGIEPVIAAIRAGKKIALASKEVMVMAGEIVLRELAAHPEASLVPVDSEHSGVFQCLAGRRPDEVSELILTASGGPFRTWPAEKIRNATPAEALKHPTWSMGRKITIDSASMMNKALELVEAKHLFRFPPEQLKVVIHPQSLVHALIRLRDGSLIAQMSVPDMRLAIRYGLSYPERLPGTVPALDLTSCGSMTFEAPDPARFPALRLAQEALHTGGTLPAVMNAANEIAVERFVSGEIPFGGIWKIVESVMSAHKAQTQQSLEQLHAVDDEARRKAREVRF